MKIYLMGNPAVVKDSMPLRLKKSLAEKFPQFQFIETDPTENFVPEEGSYIIDTVVGLPTIKLFETLADFTGHKLISPHDYDLWFHLQLLIKLKKIKHVQIIGIPRGYSFTEAFVGVSRMLQANRSAHQ
jgi:hypothetical protein